MGGGEAQWEEKQRAGSRVGRPGMFEHSRREKDVSAGVQSEELPPQTPGVTGTQEQNGI